MVSVMSRFGSILLASDSICSTLAVSSKFGNLPTTLHTNRAVLLLHSHPAVLWIRLHDNQWLHQQTVLRGYSPLLKAEWTRARRHDTA